MMRYVCRLMSVIWLVVCLSIFVSCGGKDVNTDTTTTGTASDSAITTATVPEATEFVVVSGGEAKVPLIRAEDGSDEVIAAISKLYSTISEVTGVRLRFETDFLRGSQVRTEEQDAIPAILAGPTNYGAGVKALSEITYGDGVARIEGDQLIIAAVDGGAANAVIDQICQYVKENGKQGELSFPMDYEVRVTGNKLLTAIPTVIGGIAKRTYDVGDGATSLEITQVSEEKYEAYLTKLAQSDLKQYAASKMGNNRCLTYTDDTLIYQFLYTPSDKTLRIVVDKQTATVLPPIAEPTYKKVCESSLTQLGLEYNYDNPKTPYTFTQSVYQIGMCYIFRLEDGSFIILDGGFNQSRNVDMIWDTLKALSAEYAPAKITISAWFLSHAHGDHVGAFQRFMKTYGTQVDLKYLVYDSGNSAQYQSCDENGNGLTNSRSLVKREQALLARPGQTMQFANADVEILFTDEFMPDNVRDGNSLSLHLRITVAGQTFLFGGDSDVDQTERIVKYYGDYLKSDFVQVLHHGARGGTNAYYRAVDPTVVLWPLGEYDYYPGAAGKITRSQESYHTYLYTSPHVREIILAGHTDRTLALPYTYPATRVDPKPAA